jgi:dienelactone hydrolase
LLDGIQGVRRDLEKNRRAPHQDARLAPSVIGEFFGTRQTWDGIRAFDYLLTRPEVNGGQIMVTGNSGGGTITSWMCALEPRLAARYPRTYRHRQEGTSPDGAAAT